MEGCFMVTVSIKWCFQILRCSGGLPFFATLSPKVPEQLQGPSKLRWWSWETQCRSEYHSGYPSGSTKVWNFSILLPSELDYSKIIPANVSILIKRDKRDISDTTKKCVHAKKNNTHYYSSIQNIKEQQIVSRTLRLHITLWLQIGTQIVSYGQRKPLKNNVDLKKGKGKAYV